MIYARNELGIRRGFGRVGPAICVVLAVIAVALLTRDAMGQERAEAFDVVGFVTPDPIATAVRRLLGRDQIQRREVGVPNGYQATEMSPQVDVIGLDVDAGNIVKPADREPFQKRAVAQDDVVAIQLRYDAIS